MEPRWYVVHVYSGFESKVAQSIREQADREGLGADILEVLVPTEEVVEVKRGSKTKAERKFFSWLRPCKDVNDRQGLASR